MKFSFLESPERSVAPVETVLEACTRLMGHDEKLTEICVKLLGELELNDLVDRVSVEWNTRMRSCAGRAFWPTGLIQINPKLTLISDAEVKQTVLHELAHLVAYERHPNRTIKSHGVEWQRASVDLGIPGERATHELSLPTRTLQRKWRYDCPKCEKSFERVRRFKGVVACYDCCLKTTGGRYHETFRLNEIRMSS